MGGKPSAPASRASRGEGFPLFTFSAVSRTIDSDWKREKTKIMNNTLLPFIDVNNEVVTFYQKTTLKIKFSPPSQSHHGQPHFARDSPVYPLHHQSALMIASCHLHLRHRHHPYLLMKKSKSFMYLFYSNFERLVLGTYTSQKLHKIT